MSKPFDTLEAATSFIDNGMNPELAEKVARAINSSRETDLSNLASKAGLLEMNGKIVDMDGKIEKHSIEIEKLLDKVDDVKTEVLKLEHRFDNKIAQVSTEILKVDGKVSAVDARLSLESERLMGAIEKSRHGMIVWLIATIIATAGATSSIMAALLKFLIH